MSVFAIAKRELVLNGTLKMEKHLKKQHLLVKNFIMEIKYRNRENNIISSHVLIFCSPTIINTWQLFFLYPLYSSPLLLPFLNYFEVSDIKIILPTYISAYIWKNVGIKKHSHRASLAASLVNNPPARAGDGFDPWSKKIPHAAEQLRKAMCHMPQLLSLRLEPGSRTTEAHAP